MAELLSGTYFFPFIVWYCRSLVLFYTFFALFIFSLPIEIFSSCYMIVSWLYVIFSSFSCKIFHGVLTFIILCLLHLAPWRHLIFSHVILSSYNVSKSPTWLASLCCISNFRKPPTSPTWLYPSVQSLMHHYLFLLQLLSIFFIKSSYSECHLYSSSHIPPSI